jgi:hypothetical protein
MITISNLLLVAGTGTKSGKTTLACRIIDDFRELGITAIKITPHFHETTPGLIKLAEGPHSVIYEETERTGIKDTARMLYAGAEKVYFAKVWDDSLFEVFMEIMKFIPEGTPVICESPALRNFIEPGIFVVMSSESTNKDKDISHLLSLPHVMLKLEELAGMSALPISFESGRWVGILR